MAEPRYDTDRPTSDPGAHDGDTDHAGGQHGGHGLMMMLMCAPMLAIVAFLVLTGTLGAGAFLPALLCMAAMAAMMYMMRGGHGHH
jgi:hypothetical protein